MPITKVVATTIAANADSTIIQNIVNGSMPGYSKILQLVTKSGLTPFRKLGLVLPTSLNKLVCSDIGLPIVLSSLYYV